MIDIATGFIIEPPTACSIRRATSHPSDGATLHSSEPSTNVPVPIRKNRLRPYRSAIEPPSISRDATTSVYASMIHCRPDTDAFRSARIDGSATLTIVLSVLTRNRLRQQIPSTRYRCRRVSSATCTSAYLLVHLQLLHEYS